MSRFRDVLTSFWFKILLSAVLLAVLVLTADLRQLGAALLRAQPSWVLLALAGYIFSQAISAFRWCLLARSIGFREPFRRFFIWYFAGMYLNFFAPSTVAGDVGRSLFLSRGQHRALAFSSVIADRGIGFVALVWVGAAAVVLLPGYPLPRLLRWAAWLVPPATLAAWLWGARITVRLLAPGNRWRRLVERDLTPYWKDSRLLGASLLIACIFHLVQIATQIALARALALSIPWTFFLIFVPVVNIAGMLPISMNGVGVREAGYWYFLGLVGIGREAAIAFGLASSAVVLLTGLTGAPMLPLVKRGETRTDA